jgi:hypothetical protein
MRGGRPKLGAGVAAILLVACIAAPAGADCTKDVDCKGDRVCDHGQCVAPAPAPAPAPLPASAPDERPAVPAAPPSHVDDERYKVDVSFRAEWEKDSYEVDVAGVGRCTTPCTLRGFPGPWDVAVSGASVFRKTVFVPVAGADVRLTRPTEGSSSKHTLGAVLMGASVAAGLTGFIGGTILSTSPPASSSQRTVDATVFVGLLVVGFAGLLYGAHVYDSGSSWGFQDAVVRPRAPVPAGQPSAAATPKAAQGVRLVGIGARETDLRTLVPVVSFEF